MEDSPFLDNQHSERASSQRFSSQASEHHTEMTDRTFEERQQQHNDGGSVQDGNRSRAASTTKPSRRSSRMVAPTEAREPESDYERYHNDRKAAPVGGSAAAFSSGNDFAFAFPDPIPDPVYVRTRPPLSPTEQGEGRYHGGGGGGDDGLPEALKHPSDLPPQGVPLAYPPFGVEVLKRDVDAKADMPPPPPLPPAACALPEKELMNFLSPDWDPGNVPSLVTGVQSRYFATLPHYFPETRETASNDRARVSIRAPHAEEGDEESTRLSQWQAESMERMTTESKYWDSVVKSGTYHVSGSIDSFFYIALKVLNRQFQSLTDRTIANLYNAILILEKTRDSLGLWHITNRSLYKYAVEHYVRTALATSQQMRKAMQQKSHAKAMASAIPGAGEGGGAPQQSAQGGDLGTCLLCCVCPLYVLFCGNPFQKIAKPVNACLDVFYCMLCCPFYCFCGSPFKPGPGPLGASGAIPAPTPATMGALGSLGGILGGNQEKVEYTEPIASDINVLPKLCEIDIDSVLHNPDFAPNILRRLQAERMFTTKLRLKFLYMLITNTKTDSVINLLISEAMPSRLEDFKLQLYKMRQEYSTADPGDTMRSKALALRRQLQAQGSNINQLLATRIGLHEVMDPDAIVMTRHFVFHPQPEALRAVEGIHGVDTSLLREELRERKIPPPVQRFVEENTRQKYLELARYFRDGNYMELFSVDGAFDGEQFFNANPFGLSKESYIAAVDFSVPVASLSPENYAVNPSRTCFEMLCGSPPAFKPFMPSNIYGFFEAITISPRALEKLSSINLSGYQINARDIQSLSTILRTGRVRHLDLSDCVFLNESYVMEHLVPALERCTRLRHVNFSNMLTGLQYADARPVAPTITRLVLHALRNSKTSLEEVWCSGACPRRRRFENMTSNFSTLRTVADERMGDFPTTAQILTDIIQYPNLVSVNFSYQELSAPLVTELIVYITKTSHVLFAFFDGTGQTVDIDVPQPTQCCCCCGGSAKVPSLIGVSPSLLKELTAALSRNQLRQGTGVCFQVVNDMLQRYIILKREGDENLRESRNYVTLEGAKMIDHSHKLTKLANRPPPQKLPASTQKPPPAEDMK